MLDKETVRKALLLDESWDNVIAAQDDLKETFEEAYGKDDPSVKQANMVRDSCSTDEARESYVAAVHQHLEGKITPEDLALWSKYQEITSAIGKAVSDSGSDIVGFICDKVISNDTDKSKLN